MPEGPASGAVPPAAAGPRDGPAFQVEQHSVTHRHSGGPTCRWGTGGGGELSLHPLHHLPLPRPPPPPTHTDIPTQCTSQQGRGGQRPWGEAPRPTGVGPVRVQQPCLRCGRSLGSGSTDRRGARGAVRAPAPSRGQPGPGNEPQPLPVREGGRAASQEEGEAGSRGLRPPGPVPAPPSPAPPSPLPVGPLLGPSLLPQRENPGSLSQPPPHTHSWQCPLVYHTSWLIG